MVKIEGKRGVYRFRPLLVSRGIVVNQITIMEEYCFRPLLVSRGIVDEKALRTFIRRSFRPLLVSRGIVER